MIKGMDECLFSYLSNFKVVDKNGEEIGRVGDILLDKNSLNINSLIIHGSFLEEKLEDIGVKEDIDPIVPVNLINEVDLINTTIKIGEEKSKLKTTSKNWTPSDDVYHCSRLRKTPVLDSKKKKIGSIIDIYWQSEENYVLILGGGWLEEFLESIKVFADKDLIVPKANVSSFSYAEITLNVPEITLKDTIMENLSASVLVKNNQSGFIARGSMVGMMSNTMMMSK